jgi:hypothetical protein
VGRHQAERPVDPSGRTRGRDTAGWVLGAGTVVLLLWGLWSLADDSPDPPPPGIFGAAARPGTFAPGPSSAPTDPTSQDRASTTAAPASASSGPTSSRSVTSTPTTTPGADPTLPTTTLPATTTTTLAPLVLDAGGLAVVDLGDAYEEAVEGVAARLGAADEDTGWIDASSDFGTCPGTVVRMLRWASLRLLFGDGPTEFGENDYHFFYYSQSSVGTDEVLDLRTAEGIGLDSTVLELKAAFGDALTIESTLQFGVSFFVEPTGLGLLSGTLSDSTDDGMVTSLGGGFGCGA